MTFESAAKLYRRPETRLEDIPVPHVEVKVDEKLAAEAEKGPRFEIRSFAVVGSTLLSPGEVQRILEPYVGKDKRMADIQAARDRLQKAYEEEGFPTAIVTVPQQTVASGRVRLEVIEARLGNVSIVNPGWHWYSDERLRRETPTLQPGAVIRTRDLESDLTRANRSPDRRVTPVLKAGSEPGLVDLALNVDDRIPLHAEAEWDNFHTPGTPDNRANLSLSYDNLFDLDHRVGFAWQFVPEFGSDYHDVQVYTGTYGLPAPWRPDQDHIFAYGAWSYTSSLIPSGAGINALGNGFTGGLRYDFGLPAIPDFEHFVHFLTLGVDYKHITNTLNQASTEPGEGPISIITPIRYLPFTVAYTAQRLAPDAISTARLGFDFYVAGLIQSGGQEVNFQENRGGVSPKSNVTGDYRVYTLELTQIMRLMPLLKTLGEGRFLDLPPGTTPVQDDWNLSLHFDGQLASQPLIATEQFPLGGFDSVRGYLEGELFGDHGWNSQVELRSRRLDRWLLGRLGESAQAYLFYNAGGVYVRATGTESGDNQGIVFHQILQSFGLGMRAQLSTWLDGEVSLGIPMRDTTNTQAYDPRWNFRVRSRF